MANKKNKKGKQTPPTSQKKLKKGGLQFKFATTGQRFGRKVGFKVNRLAQGLLDKAADKFGSTRAGEAWYTFNNWLNQ